MRKREVAVVLGKRLEHDGITREYRARIDCLIDNFGQVEPDMVFFTGGAVHGNMTTEADAGADYFVQRLAERGMSFEGRAEREQSARNTDENMNAVLAELEQAGYDLGGAHLTIVTSDYHAERFRVGYDRMDYPAALHDAVTERGLAVDYLCADNPWGEPQTAAEQLRVDLYLAADRFELMRTNADAIEDGAMDHLHEENVLDFGSSYERVSALLHMRLDEGPNAAYVRESLLSRLWASYLYLEAMCARGRLTLAEKAGFLRAFPMVYADVRELNTAVDPDGP